MEESKMNLTKIGTLAVIGLFSATTLAQAVARPRPRVVTPELTRPEAVKPIDAAGVKAAPKAGALGSIDTAIPSKAANDNGGRATCSREEVVQRLTARTGFNAGIVATGLNKLIIQGCSAGEEGLLNFKSDDAVKVAVMTGYYMEQNKLAGPEALAKAKNEIGKVTTTAEAEVANFNALLQGNAESCNIFRN
jgi:hypothetical protein